MRHNCEAFEQVLLLQKLRCGMVQKQSANVRGGDKE